MSELPTIDQDYLREVLIELLETPSPTGYTEQIISWIQLPSATTDERLKNT